ncbi:hypothetical protein C2S53_012406 [Perilla frutescens var. hirtella]|uniref:Uncharacterized protein n=1 Tax=Perilla frutescens var. hirtella TaxID=608512 RepID=A0AAD4PDT8_PERFH|nr:hypothetical protein C2S53_012406 [Perilla frutescens var. hirtella]
MSISEDEKLSQMSKDFGSTFTDSCFFHIELGSTITDSCLFPPSQPLQVDDNPTYFSLQEIMEECPEAEAEIYGKILLYIKAMKSKEKLSTLKKWIVFRLKMDNYEAHLCQTSWSTPFGPPSGEYDFVEVIMREKDKGKKMRIIVDIDFRNQFELARPTPNYKEVTNALPLLFVGSEEKLEKLISLICSAAKQSLRERELHIPPWRKASYMHSKWLSTNCKRVSFSEENLSAFGPINGNNISRCFQDFLQVQKMSTLI